MVPNLGCSLESGGSFKTTDAWVPPQTFWWGVWGGGGLGLVTFQSSQVTETRTTAEKHGAVGAVQGDLMNQNPLGGCRVMT